MAGNNLLYEFITQLLGTHTMMGEGHSILLLGHLKNSRYSRRIGHVYQIIGNT